MQIKNLYQNDIINDKYDKKLSNKKNNSINEKYEDDNDSNFVKNQNLIKKHGLHWITASLFIVADMVGSGIVALPIAVVRTCK